MTTPDGPQLQETPGAEASVGGMVRACDRCGTVCSTDQEWCLGCGVRMTEASQRLPGLRAAGMVVALAVLLAGGAAAASYAALRGDTKTPASVATETAPTPVAEAPAVTTPPAADTTAPVTPPVANTAPDSSPLPGAGSSTGSSSTGSTGSSSADSSSSTGAGATGSTSGGSTGSSTGPLPDSEGVDDSGTASKDAAKDKKQKEEDASGPVTFASGQGSLYDPDGVVADRGDEGKAIDGNVKTSWQVSLNEGATGGFGYVMDFDRATALKTLQIVTVTKGLVVKVLGTKKATLPPDALNNGWDTLADETNLKTSADGTTVQLQSVSGETSKYKHILVWVTEAPGTPAAARIKEFIASR